MTTSFDKIEIKLQGLEQKVAALSYELKAYKAQPWWKRLLGIKPTSLIELQKREISRNKGKV